MATKDPDTKVKRVLIYRLGSLGDTIVALPAFKLIAEAYPKAERILLTNLPINPKAPSPKSILDGTNYIHSYITYPIQLRNINNIIQLSLKLRSLQSDIFIYISEIRPALMTLRDYCFFKMSRVGKFIGFPLKSAQRTHLQIANTKSYRSETTRLLQNLIEIEAMHSTISSPDLQLTKLEDDFAAKVLSQHQVTPQHFISCAFGTKMPAKDWGEENWQKLLSLLANKFANYKLVLFGAKSEYNVSKAITKKWPNHVLNMCGELSPRESGAIMAKSKLFIGLDSGPMHLAASCNVTCVAIFSSHNKKGVWYPIGKQHAIFYTENIACKHCLRSICPKNNKCIQEIKPKEVYRACKRLLE